MLRKGFMGKYCYKRIQVIGDEKYRDVPDKTHPFSDIQDCLQYICYEINYQQTKEYNTKPVRTFTQEWV
jgi:hypothetical protein